MIRTAVSAASMLLLAQFVAAAAEPTAAAPAMQAAMDRAAGCCLAWLNPDEDFLPTGGYETAHDTGRWWDAMLRYEAATGTKMPAQAEAAMLANLRRLTDNPAALLTSGTCNPHNLRESLLAYTALVRHRQSRWAEEQGRRLVKAVASLIEDDGQMDYAGLAKAVSQPLTADRLMVQRSPRGAWFNAVASTGRALESLVLFHEATGDEATKQLAKRLAEIHFRNVIDVDGKVRAELRAADCVSHTHSYCGTLRGLLLYGLATADRKYVEAVSRTYRRGLWGAAISHSGWTPHDQGKIIWSGPEGDPLGEHGSCGDVAQIALWLALRDGQPDLLDDVERLVRARLLPAQIKSPSAPRQDGGWGVYTHPFGQGAILDVFAAVLHSLADIHRHIVTTAADGTVSVNMHFDTQTPLVTLHARRAAEASLEVRLQEDRPLRIRVPGWASRDSVRLSAGDRNLPLRWDGGYVLVDKGSTGSDGTIILRHDLPERETIEEMPVSQRRFRLTWRGDEVSDCEPQVPLYPARNK